MLVRESSIKIAKKFYFVLHYANYLRFSFFDPLLLEKNGFVFHISEVVRKILFYILKVHSPNVCHTKRRFTKWSSSSSFMQIILTITIKYHFLIEKLFAKNFVLILIVI